MTSKIFNIIFILVAVFALTFFIGYLQQCSKVDSTEQQLTQMEAAFGDTMKVLRVDNQTLYRKVADLTEMNSEDDKLIKGLENSIFSKNREIIKLKDIVSSGVGSLDSLVVIDSSCIGLKLKYVDVNIFRTLDINVKVDDPPIFNTKEEFNPFGLTTYLSRDEEGIWVGHAIIQEEFQPYIEISDMKVEIEKDEFKQFYDRVSALKFGPVGSLYSEFETQSIFNGGLRFLINEKHDFSIQKSLNSKGWLVDYSLLFNAID